jgi:hypothetical protein
MFWWFNPGASAKVLTPLGYAALTKLRGLQSVSLVYREWQFSHLVLRHLHNLPAITEDDEKDLRDKVALLQRDIEVLVTRGRDDTLPAITIAEVEDAVNEYGGYPSLPRPWGYELERILSSRISIND